MVDNGHVDMTDNNIQRTFVNVQEESSNIRGEIKNQLSQPINDMHSNAVSLIIPRNENSEPSFASNNPSETTHSTLIEVTTGPLKKITRKSRRKSSKKSSRISKKKPKSSTKIAAELSTDTKVAEISKGETAQTAPLPTTTSDNVIAGSTRRPPRRSRRRSKRRSKRRRSRRPTTPLPRNTNGKDQMTDNGNSIDVVTPDSSKSTNRMSTETSTGNNNMKSDNVSFMTTYTPTSISQHGSTSGSKSTMVYTTLAPGEIYTSTQRTIGGTKFEEEGNMVMTGPSTETALIVTEPFRNELITTTPVVADSTKTVQHTSKTAEIFSSSSDNNMRNVVIESSPPVNSEAQGMTNMLINVKEQQPDTAAINSNWKKSTMNTENHSIDKVSNMSTSGKSPTMLDKTGQTERPIGMVSTDTASSITSASSTANETALSPSNLLSDNTLTTNFRTSPMGLASLLARMLFPEVLGPRNVIIQTRGPERTILRNDGSFISSRSLTPLLTTTRRRPRIILIQPRDLSFYRKRALCSETPRRLRNPCIKNEDCRHQMDCSLGRCCATSDRHAEMLENLLERLNMRRLRRFR
ncbi:mucin-5AC-like [Pecten maximus]|uniref:mucin-5AC-like n=1 Tax=Pecten maximus TaxID=6579 RepID=UPI0014580B19|nr:mucin-5AC-like [Pecten maximus]